jgi:hypothetical protein
MVLVLAWASWSSPPVHAQPADFQPPVLLEKVEPEVPADAPAEGAVVKLEILVDVSGATQEVTVLVSAGASLDAVAVDAARRFVWRPAQAGGKAVPVKVIYDVSFPAKAVPETQPAVEPTPATPEEPSELYQTQVEGERPHEEIIRRTATVTEATRVPGTRGDALRVVENFPGVSRPPMGIGLLVVRGSNPEDTTPYFAGHFLPILYHFGGITSIVSSDLLARIDFLPGNFSARYGRAMGGVVEVELRAPRKDRLGGYIDTSLLDVGFMLEGPVGSGSVAVAARRSVVDLVLDAVLPDDGGFTFATAPRYWDYQALYEGPLFGGRFTAEAIGSRDSFALVLDDPADYDPALRGSIDQATYIQRLSAGFKRRLSERTKVYATVAQGVSTFSFDAGEFLDFALAVYYGSYRAEIEHKPFDRVKVTFGTEGLVYPATVDARGPRPPQEGEVPSPISGMEELVQERTLVEWRHGLYLEAEIDLGRGLTITPGTRADYYRLDEAFSVDPRLSARWKRGRWAVHGGVGRYSQPPLEFQSDPVYGDPDILPSHAIHYALGVDRRLGDAVQVETTGFYKSLDALVVKDDTLHVNDDGMLAPRGYSNLGSGRVYGAELLVRHDDSGRFFGWLAYTLSKAERRDAPDDELRPFSFDQTHILTLVGNVRLPRRIQAGLRLRYVTGNPQTPILGSIYDADSDVYFPIPGRVNSERVGAFLQLDARIEKRFDFQRWNLTAYLDVQNATNRINPEAYFYSHDYRDKRVISGLPIFPALGVRGDF